MLVTINSFTGMPIMSLQTGRRLATIGEPIIDPRDLGIVAFYVHGPMVDYNPAVLFVEDIREIGQLGAIVDSADNIMSPDGLVRLQEIIGFGFRIFGLKVIDDHKHKLGSVESFNFNSGNFMIEQILVKPGFGARFSVMNLTISRQQVIEVNNQQIIVKAPDQKVTATINKVSSPNAIPFENPFRKPAPLPLPETKNIE